MNYSTFNNSISNINVEQGPMGVPGMFRSP